MTRVMLSRFAQASTAGLIMLTLAGAARADTIKKFIVRGGARNVSSENLGSCEAGFACRFSGELTIDVTNGKVEAGKFNFPGLDTISGPRLSQHAVPPVDGWFVEFGESNGLRFNLTFFTHPTPASLVSFAGGSIIPEIGFSSVFNSHRTFYAEFGGSISPVPEPSSLALLGSGLLCCLRFGLVRRRKLKRP